MHTYFYNCIVTRKTNQFSEFLQVFHEVFKLLNPSEILLVYCYSLHRVTKRNGPNVGFNISYMGRSRCFKTCLKAKLELKNKIITFRFGNIRTPDELTVHIKYVYT